MLRIYTDGNSPRFQYACHILFGLLWQQPYRILPLLQVAENPDGAPALAYAPLPLPGIFTIIPSGLLQKNTIEPTPVRFSVRDGMPVLFSHPGHCALGFDIFSAVFFMAARYEEYLPYPADKYGRFPESASTSGRYDFTHLPVVHLWANLLLRAMQVAYPALQAAPRKPRAIFTYDIDVAYAYRGRSPVTHMLSLAKDMLSLKGSQIVQKLKSGFGRFYDPSDTYAFIEQGSLPKIFFFLLSRKRTRYDRNLSPQSRVLQALIRRVHTSGAGTGIHPSYESSEMDGLIHAEKNLLEKIAGGRITASRQHFLRFRLPHTFRALMAAGITDDYSMQYPEMPGFRAGLCIPFPFFDVAANEMTNLMLHPGCIMETTFRDDLQMPAAQSEDWYLNLWESVKMAGGDFICIWHNDTLQVQDNPQHPLAFRNIHRILEQKIREALQNICQPPEHHA